VAWLNFGYPISVIDQYAGRNAAATAIDVSYPKQRLLLFVATLGVTA